MKMLSVNSRAIRAVGYDPNTLHMKITFQQGHTYDFCGVTPNIYIGLMQAGSKGSYYNAYIRDHYRC